MKLITAIIQPSRLEVVKERLQAVGVRGMTVTEVHGMGRQRGHTEVYRGHEYEINLVPKVKLEIAVDDELAQTVVDTVTAAARTGTDGKIGDGKLFVSALEDVIRIRTGEAGLAAV